MKIQTNNKSWFGQTLTIKNNEVEFNSKGVAEVDEEIGKQILGGFEGMIFEFGKMPKPEPVKVVENVTTDEAKELLEQIEKLQKDKEIVKAEYESKIETLTGEVEAWKGEFEKAKGETAEVKTEAITEEEYDALADLIDQNLTDLRGFAVEKLGFDQETVQQYKKAQMVVEIFKSILNEVKA